MKYVHAPNNHVNTQGVIMDYAKSMDKWLEIQICESRMCEHHGVKHEFVHFYRYVEHHSTYLDIEFFIPASVSWGLDSSGDLVHILCCPKCLYNIGIRKDAEGYMYWDKAISDPLIKIRERIAEIKSRNDYYKRNKIWLELIEPNEQEICDLQQQIIFIHSK